MTAIPGVCVQPSDTKIHQEGHQGMSQPEYHVVTQGVLSEKTPFNCSDYSNDRPVIDTSRSRKIERLLFLVRDQLLLQHDFIVPDEAVLEDVHIHDEGQQDRNQPEERGGVRC